jgi:glucosylceramidase
MKKKYQHIATMLLGSITLTMSACSVDSNLDLQPAQEDMSDTPNTTPQAGEARVFTTTADGTYKLEQSSVPVYSGSNMAPTTIEVDLSSHNQTIDGFGFALTYSTCYNLLKMSQENRTAFLKRTFSTTEGYGVSYARISIGCSDFSSTEYSLCDTKGLENFALQSDETNYVVPVIKEILAINPNLKIIASPWTCPKWMKVSSIITKNAHDSWTDGHLNPDYREAYAQYFVKFVQAMKAQGISIYAVTPQNEPLNPGNCASLYMPWTEEAEFVKKLAAAFKDNSISTKIYLYDHNYDYSSTSSQEDYPVKIYNAIGDSFEGSELVVGAAYHDYGGSNTELSDIYSKAPTKELIFSESSIGKWNDGRNLGARLMADMQNTTLGTVNKMCKAVIVWNMMLDDKMGPNLTGGCTTCYGAVDISSSDYKTLSYNSHYYIIAHMSAAASTGAVRLSVKRDTQLSGLTHAEFLNPDGTIGAVLCNSGDSKVNVTLSDGNKYFQVSVPAQGVVSCKWNQ